MKHRHGVTRERSANVRLSEFDVAVSIAQKADTPSSGLGLSRSRDAVGHSLKHVVFRSRDANASSSELGQNAITGGKIFSLGKKVHSYIVGAGTVLDVAGSHLKYPILGSAADDMKKLRQDFRAIDGDMKTVLKRHLAHLEK